MKLAIVVVYLIGDENERLLDVHLDRIEAHTSVDYLIYAGMNRLAPRFRQRILERRRIRPCAIPATDLRGMAEHSYYLEHLVSAAIQDGASHIVTMHVDSFPVRTGWTEELAGKLSMSCPLATVEKVNTAGLLFLREFYLQYHPRFLVTATERSSSKYRAYLREHNPVEHSGTGYGFAAYVNGLQCYYLPETAGVSGSALSKIYADMLFHLGHAVRIGGQQFEKASIRYNPFYLRLLSMTRRVAGTCTPAPVKKRLRARFPTPIYHLVDRPGWYAQSRQIEQIRAQLGDNSALYLDRLRNSPRE